MNHPLTKEQQEVVLANKGLAYGLAQKMFHANPLLRRAGTREDYEQEALYALCRSVHYYDSSKGTTFATYAGRAINHSLRRFALERLLIHVPGTARLKENHQKFADKARRLVFSDMKFDRSRRREKDVGLVLDMEKCLDKLSPRWQRIVRQYYFEGKDSGEIAEQERISKQRVWQILRSSAEELAPYLKGYYEHSHCPGHASAGTSRSSRSAAAQSDDRSEVHPRPDREAEDEGLSGRGVESGVGGGAEAGGL